MPNVIQRLAWAALAAAACSPALALDREKLTENLTPAQAARYDRFDDFFINGVCGTRHLDLAQRFGVNTVRGYTINTKDGSTRETLDEALALGMMVVVSEWIPHHGENKGRGNSKWNFDHTRNVDERVRAFIEKTDPIADHPAVLMWGLGNEVHLDPPYLRYVERLSRAIHERDPLALTSLTMVNAKPDHIELIKRHAPELAVIGVQSYSVGAVRSGIKNMEKHWGKPYYYSEFNGKGPWNFAKTPWGAAYDDLPAERVTEIEACYDAIEAAPRCLGSTAFVWGHFTSQRASYFSLLLSPHPDSADEADERGIAGYPLVTPFAEVLHRRFKSDDALDNRAPLITALEPVTGGRHALAAPGESVRVRIEGADPDGDPLRYECWLIDRRSGRYKAIAGPFAFDASGVATVTAPDTSRDDVLIMAYAYDDRGGAVSTTIPLGVDTEPATNGVTP